MFDAMTELTQYTVKPQVYPAITIYTIFDGKMDRYVYGCDDQHLAESHCAALNRGELVDLTMPYFKESSPTKTPSRKAGSQMTVNDIIA